MLARLNISQPIEGKLFIPNSALVHRQLEGHKVFSLLVLQPTRAAAEKLTERISSQRSQTHAAHDMLLSDQAGQGVQRCSRRMAPHTELAQRARAARPPHRCCRRRQTLRRARQQYSICLAHFRG